MDTHLGYSGAVAWHVTDPHEPVHYEVHMYPPAGTNLSLDLLAPANEKNVIKTTRTLLSKPLLLQNIRNLYAPNTYPEMTGQIGIAHNFTRTTELDFSMKLRSSYSACDGLALPRHDAFVVTPSGCSTAVLTFRSGNCDPFCIVAHAGLKSAIDFKLVHTAEASREECSVIDAMISQAIVLGGKPERMMLRIFGSMPWEAFRFSSNDVEYGEKNLLLLSFMRREYGDSFIKTCVQYHEHICMGTLLEVQARMRGVSHIEHVFPLPLDGPFPHGERHANPLLRGKMRYLATVVHR